MANTKQAKKRARQNIKRHNRNITLRSMYRTYLKKVVNAVAGGNKTGAELAYKIAVPIIDKMVTKGIIHKNKAARHKGRLYSQIKKLAAV